MNTCSTMMVSPVDSLEVTVLCDNYTDIFVNEDSSVCRRPKVFPPKALFAEHGFSCLLTVRRGPSEESVLLDGSIHASSVIHNAEILGIRPDCVDGIVLSHGHPDHFLGLGGLMKWMKKNIPFYVHPDAFLKRRLNIPDIGLVQTPRFEPEMIVSNGGIMRVSTGPRLIADDMILMTGEVERIIPFEKGFPSAEAEVDGIWVVDLFRDDQGLAVHVKGKGLVIINGCAHAGIINIVEYARKVSGIDAVHAVLGGFHLDGPLFDPIVQPTIDEMKQIDPAFVVPMHCSGWNTIHRFASEMPDAFLLNTVGTTYRF